MAHGVEAGPFGTSERRFGGNFLVPRDGPGPADYHAGETAESPTRPETYGTKVGFATTTERFFAGGRSKPRARLRMSLCPEQKTEEDAGTGIRPRQMRTTYYNVLNGTSIGFDSTDTRFEYERRRWSNKADTPGPGTYVAKGTAARESRNRPFGVVERKFNPKFADYLNVSGTGKRLGPGTYTCENGGMIKKSFNIHSYIS